MNLKLLSGLGICVGLGLLQAAPWPDDRYAVETCKTIDDYKAALKAVQQLQGTYKKKPQPLCKALGNLEKMLVRVKEVRQELKTLQAVVRCKGALRYNRIKRWFVVDTLPSDLVFMHHVHSAESPKSYLESAITFFESVEGATKPIAQQGIRAIKEGRMLTYQQRLLLRKVYAQWLNTIEEELKGNPTLRDLQLLVSIRNHENPQVLDLFRMPQPRECILKAYVTKKDVPVPSRAVEKVLDRIPKRGLPDLIKDGERLVTFYRKKLAQEGYAGC